MGAIGTTGRAGRSGLTCSFAFPLGRFSVAISAFGLFAVAVSLIGNRAAASMIGLVEA